MNPASNNYNKNVSQTWMTSFQISTYSVTNNTHGGMQ